MSYFFNGQKRIGLKSIKSKGNFQVGFYGYNSNNSINYLLIVDPYSKNTKLYGMDKITTEEVMDKLDIFQYILVKIDKFGWWDL